MTKHVVGLNHVYFRGRECNFPGEKPHGLLLGDANELKRLIDASAWECGSSEEAYREFKWPEHKSCE